MVNMITGSNELTLCQRTPSVYSKTPTSSSKIHGFHIPSLSLDYQKNIKCNSNKQVVSSSTTLLWTTQKFILTPIFYMRQTSLHISIGSLFTKYPLQLRQKPFPFQEKSASCFLTLYFSQCWSFLTLYGNLFLIHVYL